MKLRVFFLLLIPAFSATTAQPVFSTVGTDAADLACLRERGIQCYGFRADIDAEDSALGYGAHSVQERLPKNELHRFVTLNWGTVSTLVRR